MLVELRDAGLIELNNKTIIKNNLKWRNIHDKTYKNSHRRKKLQKKIFASTRKKF
ncbi:hypothetical protein OCHUTO_0648 [Orientia chuto str. Dubai]|uniref:Uncharacterized protein n=1 Tax=Orientia chuto str. Dubai TaxID=1359168 RepID=A0A0F3MJQ0_9RICK|nr:hypothetical protein [Candidatus Orientia mediorientalis]KJV56003.1 hypothetical protein OCHUTO_0648 [Orientia chuto str. Dubai]